MRLGKKILRVIVVGGWVGLRVWQATLESACKVRLGKPTVQLNLNKTKESRQVREMIPINSL